MSLRGLGGLQGFVRVSAGVPRCRVAGLEANRRSTLELWCRADAEGSGLVVFPELGLCGYSLRDLLLDQHLLEGCLDALRDLASEGRDLRPLAIVGLPLRVGSSLFNVAAALQAGRLLALVPKAYLPNFREFEEARWFRPGIEAAPGATASVWGTEIPFGLDILLQADDVSDLTVGIELCEDFWVPVPPSVYQISAGATVICNLSASNFTVGKADLRRLLARSLSDRGKCGYLYVGAGPGESSTDLTFDADAFICENGRELAASQRFSRDSQLVTVDLDLDVLIHERMITNTFGSCSQAHRRPFRRVPFRMGGAPASPLRRAVSPHPFLPDDAAALAGRCLEIFEALSHALATRVEATCAGALVLGLSGGIDSTHAALVAANALDLLGLPRSVLHCLTLPGLGTTARTQENAKQLCAALGASWQEIGISEASRLILAAVGHPVASDAKDGAALIERLRELPELADRTVENVQARLRTLLLMTVANQAGGLVVGTGDLSEKALGWSTYAGDHIAMYDVNAGVPKTLIQFLIRWVANEHAASWTAGDARALRGVLFAILDTPISPELVPADAHGRIAQLTETLIGPYELHDFYLYHVVRHSRRPARVLQLAEVAFAGRYAPDDLKRWLRVFCERFFANQFKRSCTADGPKVGMVALSPRGDWRMPSDAEVRSWLEEVDAYPAAP